MQLSEFFEGILAGTGIGGVSWLAFKKLFNHTTKTDAETDIIAQQNTAIAHLTLRVDELFKINVELQDSYLKQEQDCRTRDHLLQDEIRQLKIKVEEFERRETARQTELSLRKTGRLKTRKTDKR